MKYEMQWNEDITIGSGEHKMRYESDHDYVMNMSYEYEVMKGVDWMSMRLIMNYDETVDGE